MANPIMASLPANGSLGGRDRAGVFTATGSGALRWQPADGARVNRALNPRFAVDTTKWLANSAESTITRVTDARFGGGTACRVVVSGTSFSYSGLTQAFVGTPLNIEPTVSVTIAFDILVESGKRTNLQCGLNLSDATENYTGDGGNAPFSVSAYDVVERKVVTFATSGSYAAAAKAYPYFVVNSAELTTFRISNIVVFWGTPADTSFFDGGTGVYLDPRTGMLGTINTAPSVSRAVFWIEEGTTNLVPNPWRAVNNTGWSATGGTTARTTTYAWQGPGAGLITATGATATEVISITATAVSHTAQAIVRNHAASTRQCQLVYNGSLIGSASNVAAWATATITAPFTGTGAAANIGVRWIDSENTETFVTYYLGAEAKTYATSPCPAIDSSGTIQTGYAWSGTAHASTSTRTAASVSFDGTNRISSIKGSAIGRFKIAADKAADLHILDYGASALTNDRVALIGRDGFAGTVRMDARTGGTTSSASASGATNDGAWHKGYGDWSTSAIAVRKDSAAKVSAARTVPPTGTPDGSATVYVGSYQGTSGYINGYLGPLAIYDRPLTEAEIAKVNAVIDANGDLWRALRGGNTFFQLRPISQ